MGNSKAVKRREQGGFFGTIKKRVFRHLIRAHAIRAHASIFIRNRGRSFSTL